MPAELETRTASVEQVRESPLRNVQLRLVESIDDAMDLKRWLGERRETPIAVDTETGGLDPHRHRLRLVQFGDMNHGWAVPWELWGGVAVEIFNSWDGEWTMHHGCFDWRFIKVHAGVELPWHKVHDTMTMAGIDDPTRPKGLKPLSKLLVDKTATAGEKALKDGMNAQGWTWDTVPFNFAPYWVYGALDPVLTAHIHHQLHPRVVTSAPDSYNLERASNRICSKMMLRGLKLDVPYVEEALAKFQKTSQDVRAWLKSAHGITSPNSGGQLSRALERYGQEIIFYTDRGAPKMDKESLLFYQENSASPAVRQLIKYILAVRHMEKMSGSYLTNFLEMRDGNDIIHPSINVMAARTGRMSVTDPALQTLPRDDKVIRGSFVPRDDNVLVSCDLDQVEMRLISHASEDEGLIQAFYVADNGGDDFFTTIASELFGERVIKGDPRRQTTKNTMYAKAYGASVRKMAETSGVPYEEVSRVNNLLDLRFPGMAGIMKRLEEEAVEMRRDGGRPGVYLDSGRFLPCEPGLEYKLLNYRTQGAAAEYMKMSLVQLDAAGMGDYLVLPIHDEVLVDLPASEAEDGLKVVQDCMSNLTGYRVPITAEGKIMKERWAK